MNHKIVDTHCHLDFSDFQNDLNRVIENAKNNNVEYFLSISVNLDKFKNIYLLTKKYKNIWCSTGIHPNNVSTKLEVDDLKKVKNQLLKNAAKKKVIGIGETGLDYYRNKENRINQLKSFEVHMDVSNEMDCPIIIHTRNAENDTINHLNKYSKIYNLKGLIHCFSSTKELARSALNNGLYISFSGIITFKNVDDIINILKFVPLDRILVETDSPYLAPLPNRGKRNEPAFVKYTLKKISEIKKINYENLAEITTKNFFSLFKKAKYEY